MKNKLRLFGIALMLTTPVLASRTQRDAELAQKKAAVEQQLGNHEYYVAVGRMSPSGAQPIALDAGYYVAVDQQRVFVALPYMGGGYDLAYSYNPRLTFIGSLISYHQREGRRGAKLIDIETQDESGGRIVLTLTIQPAGSTSVALTGDHYRPISYEGRMVIFPEELRNQ